MASVTFEPSAITITHDNGASATLFLRTTPANLVELVFQTDAGEFVPLQLGVTDTTQLDIRGVLGPAVNQVQLFDGAGLNLLYPV
jgi:hypothetical protein